MTLDDLMVRLKELLDDGTPPDTPVLLADWNEAWSAPGTFGQVEVRRDIVTIEPCPAFPGGETVPLAVVLGEGPLANSQTNCDGMPRAVIAAKA